MKKLIYLFGFLVSLSAFGQEQIFPLKSNPYLFSEKVFQERSGATTIDSTFIYSMDTLELPIWDDFSLNKFEQYDADYTDPEVSSTWYYALLDESMAVLHLDSTYCDSTLAHHDTIVVTEGIVDTYTSYFPTVQTINVSDLCNYPVEYVEMNLYRECYTLVDSVIDGVPDPDQDTIFYEPTFVQDSAHVFFVDVDNPDLIWVDHYACHNYRFAVDPWSLGVATFDGLNENGMPYDFGNASAHEEADHLTSKHINLAGKTDVYLTFLYQAKGHGNDPDDQDSLLLDFWNPDSGKWYPSGWFVDGTVTPNEWDTVHWAIPIALLKDGFRFRFRNWASTSGALDHWHIDYVNLKDNDLPTIDNFSDLAISYPINTLLKDYTSVPWDHFQNADAASKMVDEAELFVFNSDNDATNFSDGNLEIRHNGILQGGSPFVLPNAAVGGGWTGNWEVGLNAYPYDVNGIYSYDNSVTSDPQAMFDVKINIASDVGASNVHLENDTNYFQQRFDNYYSYDDGSAEAAYGLNGAHAFLAYEFEAYEVDTLTGILMHFVPWVDDLSSKLFLLTVWEDDGGKPGEIIYQDDYFEAHSPNYAGSKSGFKYFEFYNTEYAVDVPGEPKNRLGVPLTGTKFYVGWEQIDDESLQIGLDWNIDNGEKIWRNTSGTWLQSSFDCSLLIRPVFSTGLNYTLSQDDLQNTGMEISMYPNPTTNQLNFTGLPDQFALSIFDMSGRLVHQSLNETSILVSDLETGVYVVDIRDENGQSLYSDKLIKE
ncbi:MAG: T9SS type A sorting domain-containing protein [Flavobacteriales bacterium]|nr:T9SS type A sorting domain-containing protein [Flavobacteriales bacterium]